ncbi:MAG: hypothetical protein ABIJ15_05535 [bacterium]
MRNKISGKCRSVCVCFILLISSCATLPEKPEPAKIPLDYWLQKKESVGRAKREKIQNALDSVFRKALSTKTMDEFGIITMKESITLLEEAGDSAPFVAEVILGREQWAAQAKQPLFWKFRFWCVDMGGYLKDKKLAEILYSVAADRNERPEIRMRAVLSLREMRMKHFLRELFLETEDVSIREEVAKSILYLSR